MKKYIVWKILGGICAGSCFVTAFGFATMYLWNWLVPALFSGSRAHFLAGAGFTAPLQAAVQAASPKGIMRKNTGAGIKKGGENSVKNKMEHLSPEEKRK